MANYTLDESQQDYYQGGNFGGYQYLPLSEVIDNFIATYVGDEKILGRTRRSDVNFHAHRAFQELHYDTFKSCKSQEIEVCPNLRMPLPQDYVNYVKLTWVDDNGIEHMIYPTNTTSNPFPISQNGDCGYEFVGDNLKRQEYCDDLTSTTCTGFVYNDWISAYNTYSNWKVAFTISTGDAAGTYADGRNLEDIFFGKIDAYCSCISNYTGGPTCGEKWESGMWSNFNTWPVACTECPNPSGATFIVETMFVGLTFSNTLNGCNSDSDTLSNWSDPGSVPIIGEVLSTDVSTSMFQYQNNGSFFIDCLGGNIHFSSNMAGHTIILKYISDGLGTEEELVVPKLAEEAIYKWIAYGCLSAKANTPEYLVARFKKEKYAETRKAKIRLSNIKLEEITQIFRRKAEQIKH